MHELLKGDLDGRLGIVKRKNQLEADYIDHCGGKDALTPPMISLIKRIVHAELEADQAEKMALLGEFDLTDKHYGALASRQERHIGRLEELIKNNSTKPVMSLETYLAEAKTESEK